MRTIINPTDFSDCNPQDFAHYFGSTAMVWSLPNTRSKRRAFIVQNCEEQPNGSYSIMGQYLTKLREWKPKKLAFKGWNDQLRPIAIRDMYFRLGDGVGQIRPSLGRTSGALKKSVQWNFRSVINFGNITPDDLTSQSITWWAFNDLYTVDQDDDRELWQMLVEPNGLSAETNSEGVVVDRSKHNGLKYNVTMRNKEMGWFHPENRTFALPKKSAWYSNLNCITSLTKHGITLKGAV